MPRLYHPLYLVISLVFMVLCACCPLDKHVLGDPQNPYPLQSHPKVGQIVHMRTGLLVSRKDMTAVAKDARIVYFGETHDNPASHRLELDLLTSLSEVHPQHQALGMEMFVRSRQPVLDRWVAGKLGEKEFLKELRWFENWNADFAYYRDLLIFARDHRIPIIALNAEKDLVNAARVKPLDQLSAADQARLPELDTADPYHRAMVAGYFSDHSHGKLQPEGFLRAQTLWDETMAESIANFLAGREGKEMNLLVIAGGNHVDFGFGIPRRAFRRLPASYITIGGQEIHISKGKESQIMNVTLPAFPMTPYDFLAYIDYEDLPKTGVRLGVMIEASPKGNGLVIKEIIRDSMAERSGLQKEDLLLSLDGENLKDSVDLIYALKQKHPGDKIHLKVERNGITENMEVFFPLPEEKDNPKKQ